MSERKLDYSIKDEYSHELSEIKDKLIQIENERVYGLKGSQMDGSLYHNVQQLKGMISDLLGKIQDGKDGTFTNLAKEINKTI